MSVRFKLFLLWFLSYALCVLTVFIFVLLGYAFITQTTEYLTQITGLFAPYLTPIIAFWFSEDVLGTKREHTRQSAIVAFSTSGFFNVIVILVLWSVFIQENGENVIEDTISAMTNISTLLAFIAGPAIGYFFSQTGTENTKAQQPSNQP